MLAARTAALPTQLALNSARKSRVNSTVARRPLSSKTLESMSARPRQCQQHFFFGIPQFKTSLLSSHMTRESSQILSLRRYNTKSGIPPSLDTIKIPVLFISSPEAAIFPDTRAVLFVSDKQFQRYKHLDTNHQVGLFMVPEGNEDSVTENPNTTKDVASVGILAWVETVTKVNDGYNIGFKGIQRIKFDEETRQKEDEQQLPDEPLVRTCTRIKDDAANNKSTDLVAKAYHASITSYLNAVHQGTSRNYDYNEAIWNAAALCHSDSGAVQKLLECMVLSERQHQVLAMIRGNDALKVMQIKISQKVDEEVNAANKTYLLKQQMKFLKKEMGGEDDKKTPAKMYEARLKGLNVPEAVMKVINEEMARLSTNDMHSSEQNVIRNYLDWLTSVPWGIYNKENLDIHHAEKVLAEDHYGLKDVKERILEFIAVGKLRAGVQGKILCFVGPPGVGKTSIGKSIAKATNREFYRFSLGGMRDVAEIRGHRRTYIGAMPGKIVQCLKTVKSSNPVIMIDEIDKMGSSYNGDPASALLEVLDREQNSSFMDLYMDVPIDLSKVLWVATANTKDTIPAPLLDRMEVVKLSGYVLEEKVQIANKYLIPKGLADHGLPSTQVKFHKDAIAALISNWCRESGVRNLQNHIEKILRKIAYHVVKENKVVEIPAETPQAIAEATAAPVASVTEDDTTKGKKKTKKGKKAEEPEKSAKVVEKIVEKMQKPAELTETIVVDEESLPKYVGKPNFNSERYYDVTPVGVVMGLAWTSMGGALLYIETANDRGAGKPGLRVTGQLGDVMKESSQLALTYAKSFIEDIQYGNRFFETANMHMHFPAGAIPKDGPSAGVTMVSSMISLALQRPLRPEVAMTGEITLTGKVLPIGGVKEKTIAARRGGIKTIIIPADNKKDWEELEDYIKGNLKVHFADYYRDVFEVAFDSDAAQLGSTTPKASLYPGRVIKEDKKKDKKKILENIVEKQDVPVQQTE